MSLSRAPRQPCKSVSRQVEQANIPARGNENVEVDNDNIQGDNLEVLNDDIKG